MCKDFFTVVEVCFPAVQSWFPVLEQAVFTLQLITFEPCNCNFNVHFPVHQGGITCGPIDEPTKSSKAIDERVIINFRDKNVVIARFRDKNVYR